MKKNQTERVVALLPMKANSTRVKGKNFRDFCGKPLFRWMFDALLEIEEIDQIIINTDARDILEKNGLAECERICIRDRRASICGDLVSMNTILADDVENINADLYLMTHTTNPLLKSATLRDAIFAFKEVRKTESIDSLFSVNKVQSRFYHRDGTPVNHDPDNLIPTQNLEPWFEENSNIYIFTYESFQQTQARIGRKPMMYETPALESIDIDTPDDWILAEHIASTANMAIFPGTSA